MIKSEDIRQAIARLIEENVHHKLAVTFERVDKPKCDYAWVQFRTARKDEGFGMFVRNIRVDILVHLLPKQTEILAEELLDIADALDAATCGYIQIDETVTEENPDKPTEKIRKVVDTRYITIYDTSANIFDNLLTYSFVLDFADYIDKFVKPENDKDKLQYMEDLCIKLNENEYSSP